MSGLIAWRCAVAAWIGVISFSSTSLASKWCETAFDYLSALLLGGMRRHSSTYDWVHLIADKSVHVTLFCVLAILLWQAIPTTKHKSSMILACGALVGSYSELLQRFFPGRDPAVRDVMINIASTAFGILICSIAAQTRTALPKTPVEKQELQRKGLLKIQL